MPIIYTTSLPKETDNFIKILEITPITTKDSILESSQLQQIKTSIPDIDITNSNIAAYKATTLKGNCELLNIKGTPNLTCAIFKDPQNEELAELAMLITEFMQFLNLLIVDCNLQPDIIKMYDVIAYQDLNTCQITPYIKQTENCYLKLTIE